MANFFKDNLKHYREKLGLSKSKLGELTGVNQTTIGRWETGEITPSIDNVIDLMNALKIPVDNLGIFLGQDLRFENQNNTPLSKTEILFDKTKDILSDDDRATIEFIMNKTIDNYEKNKNNQE